jgi:uncharacterized protein (DUF58 family)
VSQSRVQKFIDSLSGRQGAAAGAALSAVEAHAAKVKTGTSASGPASSGSASSGPAKAGGSAFDPQVLSKLGRLELISRSVVDGFLSGKHRSTHKGGCTDFAEFRPYAQGDDIRLLDWRHFARTDRYYVKRYEDETNLQALLVADASGSMGFGMSTITKWRFAQIAAACFAHLLLRQRDSVGLGIVGDKLLDYVKPQPRASHLVRLLDLLDAVQPSGVSALPAVLEQMSGRLKRRGMVIVISDCFGDVDALAHVLGQYRHRGHDLLVFQVLAPEELTFPFRRESFFQDLELPGRMQVNPNTVRKAYLEELQKSQNKLHAAMTDCGADLMTLSTGDDLGELLAYQLRRRAMMGNATRAAAHV